jgi:hypothetical protein
MGLAGSEAWLAEVCRIYLRVRGRTLLRLMRFLDDARARHLLRSVGTIYQLRHSTLQNRLAPLSSEPPGPAEHELMYCDRLGTGIEDR